MQLAELDDSKLVELYVVCYPGLPFRGEKVDTKDHQPARIKAHTTTPTLYKRERANYLA